MGACSSSHSTGRWPDQAMHSSTSLVCSAAWIWTGPPSASGAIAASSSGVTARRLCGAIPILAPGNSRIGDFCGGDQFGELVDRADEPALAGMRRGAAKGAVRIETRQQRKSDTGGFGGSHNSRRHLGRIGIERAVVVVMQIVEFPDARKSLFEHFDIEQRCDGFRVFGSHLQRETIHRLAPCPERVRGVAAHFGEAGHAALERVTMQARYSRNGQSVAFIAGLRRRAGRHLRDDSVGHNHPHVVSPPGREQR